MNDLMTKSFLSYVELKKQAQKDMEVEPTPDLEMGHLTCNEEKNLSSFFEKASSVQLEMEDIVNLLKELDNVSDGINPSHSSKVLRGVQDRMNSDMVNILRKARSVKTHLEELDISNISNRRLFSGFAEGSTVDRTRLSVTNGLRAKLRELVNGFQSLRERIAAKQKECLMGKYYPTGEVVASDEAIGAMVCNRREQIGETVLDLEMIERNKAVNDIHRSLTNLHQVLLDMSVMQEAQEETLNDIEENVIRAGNYIAGGTNGLLRAKDRKKKMRKNLWLWVLVVVAALVLVCLLSVFTIS